MSVRRDQSPVGKLIAWGFIGVVFLAIGYVVLTREDDLAGASTPGLAATSEAGTPALSS